MQSEYNQNDYDSVIVLIATLRKKIEAQAKIESEKQFILKLLNDLEKDFRDEVKSKAEDIFNVIGIDRIIRGHLNYLLEFDKCMDVVSNPSFSSEFKLEAIEKLQGYGDSISISNQLVSKATHLLFAILIGAMITSIPAVPLIVFAGPVGIAFTVTLYLAVVASIYQGQEKVDRNQQTAFKLASKLKLFNPVPAERNRENCNINERTETLECNKPLAINS